VRGIIALGQALAIGIKAIEFSASKSCEEEEKPLTPFAISLTIGTALLLGIGLFILLPLYATKLLGIIFSSVSTNSFMFNLVDGVFRILIFLAYILIIGLWNEMRRIFEYHGAEHKVIHAYEEGKELTVQNIRDYSPLHPRCGTSFLLIVMVISIFTFSFIPQAWPFTYKFLSRVILIPVIAGVSFEALKLSSKLKNNPFMSMMIFPGLMLQKLTTREPDDAQIEVAIRAIEEAISIEEQDA
jgi:uncharacterized protein YqhQ